MSFNNETKGKFKNFEEDLLIINELIVNIGKLKAEISDPRAEKIKQKPIWSLGNYIQLAIHRVYDLATQSTIAWNNEIPVVSFLLTRAIYENTAYLFDLAEKITDYYGKDDYKGMYKLITNRLVGSRLGSNTSQIVNVLTAIKSTDKKILGFKELYDFLSDFCHPNYSGMYGIYGKLNEDNVRFYIDKKYGYTEEIFSFIVMGLTMGLEIFYLTVNNLLANMDELNDFYYKHQPLASD